MKTVLYNGRVITPYSIINGGVSVENGRIREVFTDDINKDIRVRETGAEYIDCRGFYISPGFIDVHVHGGGGSDVMDGTKEAIETISVTHAKHGTTAFCPTTESDSKSNILKALDAIKEVYQSPVKGAQVLGAHIESNYFSLSRKGAQNPKYIKNPEKEDYMEILNSPCDILMVSAAPEIPGGMEMGKELSKRGIIAAIAHSDATYDEAIAAIDSGYTHVTHLYNALSCFKSSPRFQRQAGACEAALLSDNLTFEVIADGVHIPVPMLKLIYKLKGADKMCLVTDALRATGLGDGIFDSGGQDVIVKGGKAILADTEGQAGSEVLAGSVATTNMLVRTMYKYAGTPLIDAVKMMSATPAKILNLSDSKGSLQEGMDADIVVFDEDINVFLTMVNGLKVMCTL